MGFPGWLLMGFLSNRCWADRRLRLAQGPNEVGTGQVTACSPLPSPRRRGTPASRLRVAATRAGGEARRVRPRVPGSGRRGDEEKETTTDHAFTRAGAARCSMQMRVIVAPAVVAKGSQGTALQVIRP